MKTVEELRQYCNDIHARRREAVLIVLENFLERDFLYSHRPWKAVIGNRKCKPIPIHRYILKTSRPGATLVWPDLPLDEIIEIIESLGFVVTSSENLRIVVPPCPKGKPLTFAQEWVKRINYNYSLYVDKQKRRAKELYPEFISQLSETPFTKIKRGNNCTFFEDFSFRNPKEEYDFIFYRYLKNLLAKDGIIPYENGDHKGYCVLDKV